MRSRDNTKRTVQNAISSVAKSQGGTVVSDVQPAAAARGREGAKVPYGHVPANQNQMGHAIGEWEQRRFGPNSNVHEPEDPCWPCCTD